MYPLKQLFSAHFFAHLCAHFTSHTVKLRTVDKARKQSSVEEGKSSILFSNKATSTANNSADVFFFICICQQLECSLQVDQDFTTTQPPPSLTQSYTSYFCAPLRNVGVFFFFWNEKKINGPVGSGRYARWKTPNVSASLFLCLNVEKVRKLNGCYVGHAFRCHTCRSNNVLYIFF